MESMSYICVYIYNIYNEEEKIITREAILKGKRNL